MVISDGIPAVPRKKENLGIPFRILSRKQTLGIPFRTLPWKRKKCFINQTDQGDELEGLEMEGEDEDLNGESLEREGVKGIQCLSLI
jgi:hypothetical protein